MTSVIDDRYPRNIELQNTQYQLRLMNEEDESKVLEFAKSVPQSDLLFLQRDITKAAVMSAWVREIKVGHTPSLLLLKDNHVIGCSAVVSDPHSFSPHVGDVRAILAPDSRSVGLGRMLVQESFLLGLDLGLKKLTTHMTANQEAAIQVFEDLGFKIEAVLKNHVADPSGELYDLVVLSHDVESVQGKMALYGLSDALT